MGSYYGGGLILEQRVELISSMIYNTFCLNNKTWSDNGGGLKPGGLKNYTRGST